MLYHGSQAGAFNLRTTLMEVLTSMRRAGENVILSLSLSLSLSGFLRGRDREFDLLTCLFHYTIVK